MVIRPDVIYDAYNSIDKEILKNSRIIHLTPKGEVLTQEKVKNEEFDIDFFAKNIHTMRTTGSHPGGILVKPNDIPFEYVTPLVYVSDDGKKKELSSFCEYHEIDLVSFYL